MEDQNPKTDRSSIRNRYIKRSGKNYIYDASETENSKSQNRNNHKIGNACLAILGQDFSANMILPFTEFQPRKCVLEFDINLTDAKLACRLAHSDPALPLTNAIREKIRSGLKLATSQNLKNSDSENLDFDLEAFFPNFSTFESPKEDNMEKIKKIFHSKKICFDFDFDLDSISIWISIWSFSFWDRNSKSIPKIQNFGFKK